MQIYLKYCINCGDKYSFQASGTIDAMPDVPKEHRDAEYCPKCKKIMVGALALIEKKSELKNLVTDEVDIDTLLKWENDLRELELGEDRTFRQNNCVVFPRTRRVWAGLWDTETNESSRQNQVKNPENGRVYFYRYFPSKKNEAIITVQARVKYGTNEIIDYR